MSAWRATLMSCPALSMQPPIAGTGSDVLCDWYRNPSNNRAYCEPGQAALGACWLLLTLALCAFSTRSGRADQRWLTTQHSICTHHGAALSASIADDAFKWSGDQVRSSVARCEMQPIRLNVDAQQQSLLQTVRLSVLLAGVQPSSSGV